MGYYTEPGYLLVRVGTNGGRFGTRLLFYHLSRLETLLGLEFYTLGAISPRINSYATNGREKIWFKL